MEVVFYVGMIVWGLYLVVTEDIEDVRRDFPWKVPTRLRRKKKEIESEIQVAEEALKDYMEELDMLNKEIAHLTSLYEELVNELLQLELKEE